MFYIFFFYLDLDITIDKAEQLLLSCQQWLSSSNIFWVAFQSSCLQCGISCSVITLDIIRNRLRQFFRELNEENMATVHLKHNLRNSRHISETSTKLQESCISSQEVKRHGVHGIHSSTVMGKKSAHIPINTDDVKDYDKLFEVLKFAINLTSKRFVVLIEPPLFKSDLVQNVERALMNIIPNEECFIHPDICNQPAKNVRLEDFLTMANKGILVSRTAECIGMEFVSIILIATGYYSQQCNNNTRCSILRAVESLVIVNVVNEDYFLSIGGALMEQRFLNCTRKRTKWLCEDCQRQVCPPCILACHEGHTYLSNTSSEVVPNCECSEDSMCKNLCALSRK